MAGQGDGRKLYEEIRETRCLLSLPGLHFLPKVHQIRGVRGRGKRYRSCRAQAMTHQLGNKSTSRGYSGIADLIFVANSCCLTRIPNVVFSNWPCPSSAFDISTIDASF